MGLDNDSGRSDLHERRFWKRLSADDSVVTIRLGENIHQAIVIDKSFGGIGLQLDSNVVVQAEETVTIACDGEPMNARIKRIDTHDDGTVRVACEWLAQAGAFDKIFSQLVGRTAN